jgi:hypothetical protein
MKKTFLLAWLVCFLSVNAEPPVIGKLITRSETLDYSYVGVTPIAPIVGPTEGEGALQRDTTFRRIEYSGDYFAQSFYILRWDTNWAVLSGARVYDSVTGEITQEPQLQNHEVEGFACDATMGGAKGTSYAMTSFYPYRYWPSRSISGIGFQGDGECILDYSPPSGGLPGASFWYRDSLRIEYLDPDTAEDAKARGRLSIGSERSSFHQKRNDNNRDYTRQKTYFSAEFQEGCGPHRVTFTLKKQPLDGGPITETTKEVVIDLGKKVRTQEFVLGIEDGFRRWVEGPIVALPLDCGDCSAEQSEPGHGAGPSSGSVEWSLPLGSNSIGQSLGVLRLHAEQLVAGLDEPQNFEFIRGPREVQVVQSGSRERRQFKTDRIVADIVPESLGGSSIKFYHLADENGQDAEGLSTFSKAPYLSWRVQMLDTSNVDTLQLKVSKQYNGSLTNYVYTEDFAPVAGVRTQRFVTDDGLRTIEKMYYAVPTEPTQEKVLTIVKGEDGMVSSKTEEVFEQFSWGKTVVSIVEDPDGVARTTLYDYEIDWFDGGIEQTTLFPNGRKETFFPGVAGGSSTYRETSVPNLTGGWSHIGNFESSEGNPEGDEMTATSEITSSRANPENDTNFLKRIYTAKTDSLIEINDVLYADYEIQVARYLGEDWYDGSSWYVSGWNDPTNVTSYRREYTSGRFSGHPVWEKHADGTVETWQRDEDLITGILTTVHDRGAPDPSDDKQVVKGIRRTTETAAGGVVLLDKSIDIETGLVVAQTTVVQTDDSGRPLQTLQLDGSIETRTYSDCCGHLESISRNGRTIHYEHDALGRRTAEMRDGLRFEHTYNGDGQLPESVR